MRSAFGVTLVLGAAALGCGDPSGPPGARAPVAPVAPVAPTTEATSLAAPTPVDESLERIVTTLRGDPDPGERRRAIDAYARHVVMTSADKEPLIEVVATDQDPLVRRWAALALAAEPTPDLRLRLRLLAASERDPVVRSILERADVEHAARSANLGSKR